jgi:hypothetical protein
MQSADESHNAQLRRAISRGDIGAATELAKRLLTATDGEFAPDEGASLIAGAAQRGDAEAAAIAAVIVAANAATPEQWTTALEYLQQSAECGWSPAQEQLIFLSPIEGLRETAKTSSAPPDIWGKLRRSIDMKAWLSPAAPKVMSDAPYIAKFESFLTREQCDWLIRQAQGRMQSARVIHSRTAKMEVDRSRTNSTYEFDAVTSDMVLMLVCARMAAATASRPQALEHSNILHYAVGQQFTRHHDFFEPSTPAFAREIARGGQRALTFLTYLNEDFDQAETEFSLLDRRFRCATGGALLFRNVDIHGNPDRSTLHAGLAPTRGEKWLLSQWIRGKPQAPEAGN